MNIFILLKIGLNSKNELIIPDGPVLSKYHAIPGSLPVKMSISCGFQLTVLSGIIFFQLF